MQKQSLILLSVLVCLSFCILPEDDEVRTAFPNYTHTVYSGTLKLKLGYLEIAILASTAKNMHYVYFESQDKPKTDPTILWISGGPGCSGLSAMLQENGPFIIRHGEDRPTLNYFAWNKHANLIYIEAPAGTGFSEYEGNATMNDYIAVKDLFDSLIHLFDRHVSLRKNDLYLSGSGYGAIFATKLAEAILEHNKEEILIYQYKINLKGVLLGNPCIVRGECYASGSERHSRFHYEFLKTRGFISKKMYQDYMGRCTTNYDSYECYEQRQIIDKFVNATNTSIYNVYAKCYSDTPAGNSIDVTCYDYKGVIEYLNDPHTRENWNIRPGKYWQPCNKSLWMSYETSNDVYHLIHRIHREHLKVWIYSGDFDSSIPTIGTLTWLSNYRREFEISTKRNWREWWVPGKHKGEDQVGGFIWELNDLNLVVVKGAGFRAAHDKPQAMAYVVEAFLKDSYLGPKTLTQYTQ